jgi:hypothetical protein
MRRPITRALRTVLPAAAVLAGLLTAAPGVSLAAHPHSGFVPGDLLVYRVGDGGSALGSAAAPVFLDQFSPTGAPAGSTALPTGDAGAAHALTDSGTATSDGALALSPDGRYLTAAGYHAAPGTANVTGTDAATVARLAADGTVDTSTALPAFAAGNNVRAAITSDGTNLWVAGAAGGIAHTTLGAATQTTLAATNARALALAGGQLYTSSGKNSLTVATVGAGEPSTAGQPVTNLPGNPDSGGDPYGFVFFARAGGATPDSLYVADATAGKIDKFALVNGTWKSEGSVKVAGVTGLTGTLRGSAVVLYATSPTTLATVTDTAASTQSMTGSATTLATAAHDEAFRGVAFTPGTAVATTAPTVTPADTELPAALGDTTNPGLPVTVSAAATVTAASSDPGVAAAASVTGSGGQRTLTVTPAGVGHATITLTATDPDGAAATATVDYAVSAALPGQPDARYHTGAGNGSAIIDVGGGYQLVGDDESDVLRLYSDTTSGPATRTFDFTGQLPFGADELDLEAAARVGNRIYWCGSMSNSSSGTLEPSRSTVFATDVTGSGAATTLTYVGAYPGLRADLIAWDQGNGNALGFAASAASGVGGHTAGSFNVEGLEFAPDDTTAYLAFRGPLETPGDRADALIVPVTNLPQLVTGAAGKATFGAAIEANLGGLGYRDIRRNAEDQYLIIAGAADETDSYALYSWDGQPADPPTATGTPLPAGAPDGSWESLGAVPDPLVDGAAVPVMQDNGNTAWYGDGQTSKDDLAPALQKDVTDSVLYRPATS